MKNQVLFTLAALFLGASAFGQGVENDDMYFNSKDRAKLKSQQASEEVAVMASAKKTKKNQVLEDENVNPTDSYSARNVNPEFAARSNSQTATADNQDYFVNNYKYNTSSNLNSWNNNFNNWYSNPWYSSSYYGSSVNGWNNPYYAGYDTWGNPWCSPYQSGWSSSFGFYGGSSWGYGMGMGYGYGNPYMNVGYSWGGYPSYGYGGGYYGSYYPTVVIINNNGGENGRHVAYGRRASRGGAIAVPQDGANTRTRSSNYTYVGTRPTDSGGRVSTSGRTQPQADYYNRSWRNSQQNSSYPSRGSSYSNNNWGGNSSNQSGSDSFNRHDSNSSYSPSRSSSFDGGGGNSGSRQSAPASSGSNGRTRGRD